jgi:outer membrane lipoprotein
MILRPLLLLCVLLLGACSSTQQFVDTGPTPSEVVGSGTVGGQVHWGGQIIKVKNLRDHSLVEVLAFPLNSDGRPQLGETPLGRFIVEQDGFLEPKEYARDRLLEVRGLHEGFTDGQVGDAAYRYPVVTAQQLQLWAAPASVPGSSPRVLPRIGIGIGTGSGGSRVGGGVGIGIGF